MKPKVSIVIVNWNGIGDTIECLESLKKINYPNYEVILVDNGSKDNQADKIKKKFPNIILIKNKENEGFCKANNQGITLALKNKSDYVLLLNNDTVVNEDFLDILVKEMEEDKTIGISSPSIVYYKSNKIWSNGGKIIVPLGISIMIDKGKEYETSKFSNPNFLTGCAMFIRKDVINKIGLLDEDYFAYYEDVDYSFRVQKAGFSIKVVPKSIIQHKKSASAGIKGSNKLSGNQAYLQMRNSIIFLKKNKPFFIFLIYILPLILAKGSFTFLSLKDKKDIKEIVRGVKDGFKNK